MENTMSDDEMQQSIKKLSDLIKGKFVELYDNIDIIKKIVLCLVSNKFNLIYNCYIYYNW